jgi:hypothetical protein
MMTPTGLAQSDAEWKRRMRKLHGLTTASGSGWWNKAECPHWLTRNGHRGMRETCPMWQGESLLWDHAMAWVDSEGRRVIALEPYGDPDSEYTAQHLAALRERLRPLGITATLDPRSPYGAGMVVFLTSARPA